MPQQQPQSEKEKKENPCEDCGDKSVNNVHLMDEVLRVHERIDALAFLVLAVGITTCALCISRGGK